MYPAFSVFPAVAGVTSQVLTPVRRSARKVKAAGGVLPDLQPMLEATNYCYTPNDALQR